MNKLKELLNDADPLRREPSIASSRRDAARQAILAGTAAAQQWSPKAPFRMVRLALVAAGVLAILFFGSRFTFETHAAVRFEIRLAETDAAPGLVGAEVRESGRIIYLHPEVLVSNGDVARAELLPGNLGRFLVGIRFTPEAAQKMLAATGSHIDRPLAILIDDTVVMAPTVRTAVGEQAEINGDFTYEHAERIVNGLQ